MVRTSGNRRPPGRASEEGVTVGNFHKLTWDWRDFQKPDGPLVYNPIGSVLEQSMEADPDVWLDWY